MGVAAVVAAAAAALGAGLQSSWQQTRALQSVDTTSGALVTAARAAVATGLPSALDTARDAVADAAATAAIAAFDRIGADAYVAELLVGDGGAGNGTGNGTAGGGSNEGPGARLLDACDRISNLTQMALGGARDVDLLVVRVVAAATTLSIDAESLLQNITALNANFTSPAPTPATYRLASPVPAAGIQALQAAADAIAAAAITASSSSLSAALAPLRQLPDLAQLADPARQLLADPRAAFAANVATPARSAVAAAAASPLASARDAAAAVAIAVNGAEVRRESYAVTVLHVEAVRAAAAAAAVAVPAAVAGAYALFSVRGCRVGIKALIPIAGVSAFVLFVASAVVFAVSGYLGE
ncbi:hypothetical protein HK405_009278, partial [Cladochytrium tenue]